MLYFWSGSLAVICSWMMVVSMSGCRFGNNVEKSENTGDGISGYYETAVQSVQFCAPVCVSASGSSAPRREAQYFSNPVGLKLLDATSRMAGFFDPQVGDGFYVRAYEDSTVSINGAYKEEFIWPQESACITQDELTLTGKLHRGEGPYTTNTTLPLSGRAELSIVVTKHFAEETGGICATVLQKVKACYLSAADCEQEPAGYTGNKATYTANRALHEKYAALLNPYIDAGALTANDIPGITSLGYRIKYK